MRYLPSWVQAHRVLGVTLAVAVFSGAARAADAPPAGSLKFVPADAGFYSCTLRAGEQLQAVTKSKAWAKIKEMPTVKMGLQHLQEHLKNPKDPKLAQLLKLYEQPENKQLVELLGDLMGQEVFCYGGPNTADFLQLLASLQGSGQIGNIINQIQKAGGLKDPKAQQKMVLSTLAEHLELIKIPDFIIGFKVGKRDDATAQLKRLETLVTQLLQQAPPPVKQGYKKEKIAGADFMVMTVDGSLLPWQKISLKDYEDKEGEYDKLIEKLKTLKLTVSLGLRDDYVFLALGESTAGLSKLGSGELLADRPELKPLAKYAGNKLTSINYASKDLRSSVGTTPKDIDNAAAEAKKYLEKAEIPDGVREKLIKDLGELARDIKSFIHEKGALMSFAFLSDQGQESYTYDWSHNPSKDGSKPLTLLDHVGGAPLLAVVGRSTYKPENYQLLVKWVKKANSYFEELVLPLAGEAEKGKYEQFTKIFYPLLQRLDKATSTMLLPALKDGQSAFVLDGKLTSKQWQKLLPTTDKPMPILEPALVVGVSDADLLRQAMREYRTITNELISKLHDLQPEVPDKQIPEPETQAVKGGTLYFYPLDEDLGVDKQLMPCAGLSNNVAVLAISKPHAERLLTPAKVKAGGPLADTSKPLAGAVIFDWAGLVTTVSPWVEFGMDEWLKKQGSGAAAEPEQEGTAQKKKGVRKDGPSPAEILSQVKTGLEILKCFRGYT
ncbi:MAG: hypothetical protein E6K70_09710, partial [Planctomycetota bacterium]